MGLRDRMKKAQDESKQATWSINKKRGNVILEDKYLLLKIFPNKEHIIFYKDIKSIERKYNFVTIKSNVEEFKIAPLGVRDLEDKAKDLQLNLLDKMNQ